MNIKQGTYPHGIIFKTALKKQYESKIAKLTGTNVLIDTPEGEIYCQNGDYVVEDVNGNSYVIKEEHLQYNYMNLTTTDDKFNICYVDKNEDGEFKFFTGTRKKILIKYAIIDEKFTIEQVDGTMFGEPGDILVCLTTLIGTVHLYRIERSIFEKTYHKIEQAIFIGRFSPFHNGHEKVVAETLAAVGSDNFLTLIGSSASKISDRLTYDYIDRKNMILKLFPKLSVCGIPDFKENYPDDTDFMLWKNNLWDIIRLKFKNANYANTLFITGSYDDIKFFNNSGYLSLNIVDRKELNISATKVRKKLNSNEDISDFVNPKNLSTIIRDFKNNHEKYR